MTRHAAGHGIRQPAHLVRVRRALVVLLLAGAGAATAVAAPAELAAQTPPDSPELLRAGDVVQIQVWRQPEFSGEFQVTERGVIAHPLYREVTAAGRPVAEVEETLAGFLRNYEASPNFVIQGLFRVAVGGEVSQPNVHLLSPGTTVAEAVAMTGGINDDGRLDRVLLRRADREYRLDLLDPASDARQITIRSGDEIVVDRRTRVWREVVLPAVGFMGSLASIFRAIDR